MSKDPKGWAELPLTVSLSVFCQWTGLGRNTVQKLAREGGIKTVVVSRRRRYLKSAIAEIAGFQWRA